MNLAARELCSFKSIPNPWSPAHYEADRHFIITKNDLSYVGMQRFLRFDSPIIERNEIFDFSINGFKEFYTTFLQTMTHTHLYLLRLSFAICHIATSVYIFLLCLVVADVTM